MCPDGCMHRFGGIRILTIRFLGLGELLSRARRLRRGRAFWVWASGCGVGVVRCGVGVVGSRNWSVGCGTDCVVGVGVSGSDCGLWSCLFIHIYDIYIYIYTYTHTHIYIYIYIYINLSIYIYVYI
jgi:hypothetical protein